MVVACQRVVSASPHSRLYADGEKTIGRDLCRRAGSMCGPTMSEDDVVSALREYAEEVRTAEVAHAERRFRGLSQSERDLLELVSTRIVEGLLARPAAWFHREVGTPIADGHARVLAQLFELEPVAAARRRGGARRPALRNPKQRRKRMAGYTVVRIKDVENFAPQVGLDQDQYEIRLLRAPLGCETYGVSYERYAPGWRHPFGHRHTEQEEVYVLVNGHMRMKLDKEIIDLEPWMAVRVSPETIRGLHNPTDQDAQLIVIGAPATEQPDYELLPGWWKE